MSDFHRAGGGSKAGKRRLNREVRSGGVNGNADTAACGEGSHGSENDAAKGATLGLGSSIENLGSARNYPTIYLKKGRDESLKRFHPWVFSGAIDEKRSPKGLQEGDIVLVKSFENEALGIGMLEIGSIAIKILSFDCRETIDCNFFYKRLSAALEIRRNLGLLGDGGNSIYRLCHGEGDFLPSLVIDIYGKDAVIQAHSLGIHLFRKTICQALVRLIPELNRIYYKSETTLSYMADVEADEKAGFLFVKENIGSDQDPSLNFALENNLKFFSNYIDGQKTGFFIDQRDNRHLVAKYSKGKTVLNMFCYTGGFSVYALSGGAKTVDSVDSSAKAIEATNKHISCNFSKVETSKHHAFTCDAFEFLRDMPKDKYDLIILDPPAFAKRRSALKNALIGYRRLNAAALEKLAPNSILFTFSCSQAVSKEDFRNAVFSAAAQSGRKVRILSFLSQGGDHPINIYHPEGEYLKGLMLHVE